MNNTPVCYTSSLSTTQIGKYINPFFSKPKNQYHIPTQTIQAWLSQQTHPQHPSHQRPQAPQPKHNVTSTPTQTKSHPPPPLPSIIPITKSSHEAKRLSLLVRGTHHAQSDWSSFTHGGTENREKKNLTSAAFCRECC
ncbi:hypothetical protein M431DRAFT_507232 [Trichoderma harzianum CBS 226.95]|uniref:Uncharacterized protein n=1 Tax=Trichoderma harzianum CBS 226.95 TaxID=983964 RepID=A0A2T4AEQ2_TRIHA|nr:hypothetical protein M431DRAFT_507232 [Trichoderma harzianum CBS 226.95]PTB55557.1 hypothetical protein M431DRAFT_507232 [Trichoderma harzianum CBS 226.95]